MKKKLMENYKHKKVATRIWMVIGLALLSSLLITGCQGIMVDQPRADPLEASSFFPNGQSSRPLVAGSYPWQDNGFDPMLATGKSEDGQDLSAFPYPITLEVLQRGRERFDIFCSPCHGFVGNGDGTAVQQGFPAPPSFNTDDLRGDPPGHFVDVIANGFGKMLSYGYRVGPADRWAVVAYIKALQLSQNATLHDVPPEERTPLATGTP